MAGIKPMYTLVSVYASTRVIDAIHTRHQKLTAMIIREKQQELTEAIHARMVRGITLVPAKGAFSNEQKEMMMIVITRYELYELEHIIKEVDPMPLRISFRQQEFLGISGKINEMQLGTEPTAPSFL